VQALKGDLDLHEVTTQIKQTELAFEFSMQVRNKFIDAYREVMRMSV
jgi:flagellar hook-basal body complex protein FliE